MFTSSAVMADAVRAASRPIMISCFLSAIFHPLHVSYGGVAPQAGDLLRLVRTVHGEHDVFVTTPARGLGDAPVPVFDLDRVRKEPGCEGKRMEEAVQCLCGVLPEEVVRRVAVVADRGGTVARLQPAVMKLAHDVAIGA